MMINSIKPLELTREIQGNLQQQLKPHSKPAPDFGDHMKNAIMQVAEAQANSAKVTQAFEAGQETDVTKVMLAREKSRLAFEATLPVRNKLLSAYKDIVSMPV